MKRSTCVRRVSEYRYLAQTHELHTSACASYGEITGEKNLYQSYFGHIEWLLRNGKVPHWNSKVTGSNIKQFLLLALQVVGASCTRLPPMSVLVGTPKSFPKKCNGIRNWYLVTLNNGRENKSTNSGTCGVTQKVLGEKKGKHFVGITGLVSIIFLCEVSFNKYPRVGETVRVTIFVFTCFILKVVS